jgi:hypothetical protein
MFRNAKTTTNPKPKSNTNAKNVNTGLKKYCKVCHDAGKTEAEYTSHYVRETRDPKSKVVCPTLLSLECRYCFLKGHTVTHCDVLKKKIAQEKEQPKICKTIEIKVKPTSKSRCSNVFVCLDLDEDNKTPLKRQEEFPPISPFISKKPKVIGNYATALTSLVPVKQPPKFIPEPKIKQQIEFRRAPWASKEVTKNMPSWDIESSDDDTVVFSDVTFNEDQYNNYDNDDDDEDEDTDW